MSRCLPLRRAGLGLAAILVVGVLLPAAAAEQAAPQTHLVPMRDGVHLATDVYPGQEQGPWPVVLVRTPYGKKNSRPGGLQDYAVVVQDVRGRYDSEGHALAFFDDGWGERQDGLDTVKWILAQPWCSGSIGTFGGSALGITQTMLAGAEPPGVVCQQIVVGAGSMYHDAAYPGGLFGESLMAGWLKAAGWPEDNLQTMLAHPAYDDLWRTVDATARVQRRRVSIPAVHVGGWYDIFTQGTIDSFVARSRVAPNQWLVMGPWPHGIKQKVGELVFPANARQVPRPGMDAPFWMAYWLKGEANGLPDLPRVQYYVMGACGERGAPGNEWRSAPRWPVPAQPTPLYLAPGSRLSRQAPAQEGTRRYHYDPRQPVPTRGGRNLLIPAGALDQRPNEGRPDVLTFTSPPLREPLEVTGRITLRLWAASSAPDTAFVATLCDVYPDGRSMLVTEGALRAACRRSFLQPTPLESGQVYEFRVDLASTSIIFNRGHRLRLDLTSSSAPRYAVHPNLWGQGEPQVARQAIHYGAGRPSALLLPVVRHRWPPPAAWDRHLR